MNVFFPLFESYLRFQICGHKMFGVHFFLCRFPNFCPLQTEFQERNKVAAMLKEFVMHQKEQLRSVESRLTVSDIIWT